MKREEHNTKSLRQRAEEVANEKGLMKQNPYPSRQFENSLQLLEKTFASLREAVFIIDAKTTRILNCNPAASQIFGYRKEEMLGQTTNFLHVDEERLEEFRKSLFSAVEERGCLDMPEFQMKRRNGEVFFTNHSVRPLEDDQGKRIGWVSVVRDITDRKRAEQLLMKNENRLKRSQEIAHLGSWELDLVNNILIWSDEVYRIFGLQSQQFGATYEAFLETVHPDDRTAVDAAYSGSLREGRDTYESEHRVVRKSTGEIRYVHEKCEHVRDEAGKIIRSEGMVHDITERKRAEEQLKHSREQLRAFSAKMEMIREEERARIAREIHDELGQGLTALKMDLVWLTNRLSQEPKMLRQRTRTMSKLIDSTILSVRRISSELRPGVLDDLGLTAAIEWGSREFQKRTGIQHQFRSNKEEFDLTKDCATAIFRIFQEALTNVTRHARATRINVTLEENAGGLILEVRDNGTGITEKEISNPKSMGLLGMRERALLFGGEIKISGAPGKGTTVRLEIPLKKPMNGKKEGHRPGRMRRRG